MAQPKRKRARRDTKPCDSVPCGSLRAPASRRLETRLHERIRLIEKDDPWQPGPRPAWVRSLHASVRPEWIRLDADELLDVAQRNTGLSDFGGGEFQTPYRIFVRACESEAKLHSLGRMLVRGDVLTWLENRLRLIDARKRDSAIAAQRIERPIFITGLPRTGTTILHELFMQDPDNRVPLHWEVRQPCPAPTAASYASDPRIAQTDDELQLWNQIVPEYAAMHELGARIPVEDIQITTHTFVSDELMGRQIVPSYAAWFASADKSAGFAFHRQFLQHLQSHHAGKRWVLKSPSWLGLLPVLFGEYPDARVVVTHRDPLKVLPSVVSILYSTAFVRSDAVDAEMFKGWFSPETCRALLDGMCAFRDAGRIAATQFCDVQYADVMRDPAGALARVYERFGLAFAPELGERIRAYVASKPRGKHGAHRYAFEKLGRNADAERARFRSYQERFGVPAEG